MILCGPFVDSKQSLIDQCETDGLSYEEIFGKLIKTLEELLQDLPMTQVILQPSTRDVHHKFIFPTPEFKIEVSPRIVCVPDPAMVCIFSCQITLYHTNFLSFNNFFFDDRSALMESYSVLHPRTYFFIWAKRKFVTLQGMYSWSIIIIKQTNIWDKEID